MALSNIVGDMGYIGYAFAGDGFVSLPKLAGASFTMLAHLILLAYGDDQMRTIEAEKGALSNFILSLREQAQKAIGGVPIVFQNGLQAKPVGITFMMLALNGLALAGDGFLRLRHGTSPAMNAQIGLGILVFLGTSAFAAADFVKKQKLANILVKVAPALLTCASIANVALALTTWNPFVILSVMAFAVSNFAGFFTKIEKEKGQHSHS